MTKQQAFKKAFLSLACASAAILAIVAVFKPAAKPAAQEQAAAMKASLASSPQQLIDNYNKLMGDMDRSMSLPDANLMKRTPDGSQFLRLMHKASGVSFVIEVDKINGSPYSISAYGAVGSPEQNARLAVTIATIGAATMGSGDTLIKACSQAGDSLSASNLPIKVDGRQASCEMVEGILFGSVKAV